MNTILITTEDNMLSSLFWEGYCKTRKAQITKVILLPERAEVDFPVWLKPFAYFKMLGLSGVKKMLFFKFLSPKISVFDVCSDVSVLDSLDQDLLVRELKKSRVDVLISVGAPVVFKPEILSVPSRYCLNVHNGDIRKFRGHFSTFWEVATLEDRFCVTLHEMGAKVDSGVIYRQKFADKRFFRDFQEVMFWKKRVGGAVLADALNALDDVGHLDSCTTVDTRACAAKYYPFPRTSDVLKFRY